MPLRFPLLRALKIALVGLLSTLDSPTACYCWAYVPARRSPPSYPSRGGNYYFVPPSSTVLGATTRYRRRRSGGGGGGPADSREGKRPRGGSGGSGGGSSISSSSSTPVRWTTAPGEGYPAGHEDGDNRARRPTKEPTDEPVVRTLGGGTALIFQMARQMFAEQQEQLLQTQPPELGSTASRTPPPQSPTLPRWHPTAGISDDNPQFRTSSPRMNHQGYAGTIWRNVRKHRPSMWRYALRTYDRMAPEETQGAAAGDRVERTTVHHEGALLACAKLGLWQRALDIYADVERQQELRRCQESVDAATDPSPRPRPSPSWRRPPVPSSDGDVLLTENMLLSVVRACVRASSSSATSASSTVELRRAPLDAASELLRRAHRSPDDRAFPLVARHVNPVAAAYQSLGLVDKAQSLLTELLHERTRGPEEEDGADPFNVHDVRARDKASYALLVRGNVCRQDWPGAVDALRTMTEAGLYPASRHLNAWTEIAERRTKHRTTRSRTKKRDTYWLDSVR